MLLFVGLGNPTPDSENNRHNVGLKLSTLLIKNLVYQNKNPNLKDYSQLEMLVIKKSMQSNL